MIGICIDSSSEYHDVFYIIRMYPDV